PPRVEPRWSLPSLDTMAPPVEPDIVADPTPATSPLGVAVPAPPTPMATAPATAPTRAPSKRWHAAPGWLLATAARRLAAFVITLRDARPPPPKPARDVGGMVDRPANPPAPDAAAPQQTALETTPLPDIRPALPGVAPSRPTIAPVASRPQAPRAGRLVLR